MPDLNVDNATTGHDSYEEFLGLRKEFRQGLDRQLPIIDELERAGEPRLR